MPSQQDIDDQKQRLADYRAMLAHYLGQRTKLGSAYEPPGVAQGITEARAGIGQTKNTLRAWGVAVENHPDDEAQPAGSEPLAAPLNPRARISSSDLSFFSRWVQASALGSTLGAAIGQAAQMMVTLSLCTVMGNTERYFVGWVIGGLLGGALIGLLQALVLRERIAITLWWVLATAVGFGFGWGLRDWQGWQLGQAFGDAGYIGGWLLAGLSVGLAQAIVLRRFVHGARWMILAQGVASLSWWYGSKLSGDALSVAAVMLGWDTLNSARGDISACFESTGLYTGPLGDFTQGLPIGIIGGIATGILTGIVFIFLLQHQRPRRSSVQTVRLSESK